jgi:predicted NAD-dependent protein-ADP-ribosyltransferase YbiA (DUF1768 family)
MKKIKQPTNLESFWRSREKRPDLFTFTSDGNAKVPAVGELPEKIFPIPKYRPVTTEELDTLWAERESKFDPIYEQIEKAKIELRAALEAYKAGAGTALQVVRANQVVADLESQLVYVYSPQRYIEDLENPVTREIVFDNRYEIRKIGYNVFDLKANRIPLQSLVKELTEAERQTAVAIEEGQLQPDQLLEVITDETMLGLHWPGDLVVNEVKYFTAYQAILGTIASEEENQVLLDSILGTRSARTLRQLTKDLRPEQVKPSILEIITDAAIEQYPGFGEALVKTGDKQFAYADPLDRIFAVGLDAGDPNIQQSKRWKGKNLWGLALEAARSRYRERTVVEEEGAGGAGAATAVKQTVTEEEQKKARTGAIIAQRKFSRK